MKTPKHISGFTLIELMISLALVAILATLAMQSYLQTTKRAYVADGLSLVSSVKFATYEYFYHHNRWPLDNAAAELDTPQAFKSQAVKSISIQNGHITISYNAKVLDNATIVLIPQINAGTISWDCSTGTVAKALRPANCH